MRIRIQKGALWHVLVVEEGQPYMEMVLMVVVLVRGEKSRGLASFTGGLNNQAYFTRLSRFTKSSC